MAFIKVKEHKNLRRDSNSNAIINVDDEEYNNYIQTHKKIASEKEEKERFKDKINNLETEVKELKELIIGLYKHVNNIK